MGEEVKKISFGFSKFTKKTQIVSSRPMLNQNKTEKTDVELIDCFEGNSIKLKNPVQPVDNILVIPLKRHQETKLDSNPESDSKNFTLAVSNLDNSDSLVKVEPSDKIESVVITEQSSENKADLKTLSTKILSLDEIAAKEILEDLKEKKSQDESRIFTVPLTNNPPAGETESSLEDYNNIPVGDFGLAMLRGMGWAPGKGIGKNEKLVTPSLPALRPKGMGLGADKVLKPPIDTKTSTEELKMVKNSYIRVIAGQYKDSYGQIEGFDDETGRLIVKLALKNTSVSLNEFMVHLVDKGEFLKNSKVINVSKYEQYKDDESKKPEKCDHIIKRKIVKQNAVDEHEIQHKGKQFGPNLSSGKITKYAELDVDSPVKGSKKREVDKRKGVELPRKLHGHKHSNKRRSRSSSTSTSNEKSYKMSKDSSKRAMSSSSSTNSVDSYRKKKISTKSKHQHLNIGERSFQRESVSKKKARSRSTSSSSSSELSDYYKKNVNRTEKRKSISKKYKSKRRSKSPKEWDSSKKHKNKYR